MIWRRVTCDKGASSIQHGGVRDNDDNATIAANREDKEFWCLQGIHKKNNLKEVRGRSEYNATTTDWQQQRQQYNNHILHQRWGRKAVVQTMRRTAKCKMAQNSMQNGNFC